LNHKIGVLCEKPFAANPVQVKEMAAAAQKNGVLLQDGIASLYVENFGVLKRLLSEIGRLRRVVFVQGKYSSRYDAYLRGENPATFRREFCNGSLMDMGVYAVSVTVGLFGKPKKILSNATKLSNGIDCMGSAIFIYDDFEAVILHTKVTNSSIVSEIQGEQGNITIGRLSRVETLYLEPRNGDRRLIGEPTDEGFKYQLLAFKENFYQKKVEPSLVPHSLSLDIAEVMFSMRQQSGINFPCYGEDLSEEIYSLK
jgi:predicted dehydrogenase